MQVGMEKAVVKNHLEADAYAQLNHLFFFPGCQDGGGASIRLDTFKVLHAQHIAVAEFAIDLWEMNVWLVFEICGKGFGIVGFKT
jgi:hypothetical protein